MTSTYDKLVCYLTINSEKYKEDDIIISYLKETVYNIYNYIISLENNRIFDIYYLIPDLDILDSKKIYSIVYVLRKLNMKLKMILDTKNNKTKIRYYILCDSMLYNMQKMNYVIENAVLKKSIYSFLELEKKEIEIKKLEKENTKNTSDSNNVNNFRPYMVIAAYLDCNNIYAIDNNNLNELLKIYCENINGKIGKMFLEKYNNILLKSDYKNSNNDNNDNYEYNDSGLSENDFLDLDLEDLKDVKLSEEDIEKMKAILELNTYIVEEYILRKYELIKEEMGIIKR